MSEQLHILDKLDRIAEIKEEIKDAINTKGVEVDETVPLSDYPDKILEIESGGPVIYPLVKVLEEDWDETVKEDNTLYAIV